MKSMIEEALKRVFNPEFLNRIDDTIIFHQLEKSHIMEIIEIQMRDLLKRMTSMGITIELTKQAKDSLPKRDSIPPSAPARSGVRCRGISKIRLRRKSSRANSRRGARSRSGSARRPAS